MPEAILDTQSDITKASGLGKLLFLFLKELEKDRRRYSPYFMKWGSVNYYTWKQKLLILKMLRTH